MATTISLKEKTAEKLRMLMNKKYSSSLDQIINALIDDAENVPSSMFGVDEIRIPGLTQREHEEFQRRLE